MVTIPVPVTLNVRGFSCRVGTPPQALNARASTAKVVNKNKVLERMVFSFRVVPVDLGYRRATAKKVPLNFTKK
jgi:hypothetical protein